MVPLPNGRMTRLHKAPARMSSISHHKQKEGQDHAIECTGGENTPDLHQPFGYLYQAPDFLWNHFK